MQCDTGTTRGASITVMEKFTGGKLSFEKSDELEIRIRKKDNDANNQHLGKVDDSRVHTFMGLHQVKPA